MRVVPFFMLMENNLLKAIPKGILCERPSYVFMNHFNIQLHAMLHAHKTNTIIVYVLSVWNRSYDVFVL